MGFTGIDIKGSSINRAPESLPADQLNNNRERVCVNNRSSIKPQMMRQVLSYRGDARNGSCNGEPQPQVLVDSYTPALMGLFPQKTISSAANHKTPACKYTHTAAPGSLQSQRSPFLSIGSVQTNATISRPTSATATAGKSTTAPLTIFYNGAVSVFDVPAHKAEAIMMLATTAISSRKATSTPTIKTASGASASAFVAQAVVPAKTLTGSAAQQQTGYKPNAGLQMTRKQSLQRFLEKRQERQNSTSPYAMKIPESSDGCTHASVAFPTV